MLDQVPLDPGWRSTRIIVDQKDDLARGFREGRVLGWDNSNLSAVYGA
jgi:hypothetical protein